MQSKYYVSMSFEDNQYIGRVYLTANNELVYSSKPYGSQEQATADVRYYIIHSVPPDKEIDPPTKSNTPIVTTANYTTRSAPIRRCCGR